jgi:cytidylate kinase
MAVITISRELGSEGDKIADLLCQELGYSRVDKAILMQIAEEAGVDVEAVLAKERGFAQRARLISDQMISLYRKQPTAFERRADLDDQTYEEMVRKALAQFAEQGDVIIVGRGGQMVLHDWPMALHVHVYAPLEVRVERLRHRFNISAPEAQRRIAASDEQKRQYVRHMHNNANWKDLKHYHLTINTGHIAPEVAAQAIIVAAKHKENVQPGVQPPVSPP